MCMSCSASKPFFFRILPRLDAASDHVLAQTRSCPCGTNSQECYDPIFGETYCYPLADFWLLDHIFPIVQEGFPKIGVAPVMIHLSMGFPYISMK